MSSLIDLSAATPATRNAIAEEAFAEKLQTSALAQMLELINQGKPQLHPQQRAAIELLQTEGIAVATEFLAQQCGIGEHEWVKLLRAQIIEANTSSIQAAEAAHQAEQEARAAIAAQPSDAPAVLNVSVGYAPTATAENAGAIRSAILLSFIQLSQQFPDSKLEATAARVALGWIPSEDGDDDAPGEASAG